MNSLGLTNSKGLQSVKPYHLQFPNNTITSKVGAISKAQRAQNLFYGEKHKIFEFFLLKSRIVPKNVKGGTLLDLLTYIPLQNIKKLEGGTFREH